MLYSPKTGDKAGLGGSEAAGNIMVDKQLLLEMATRLKNEHMICSPYIIASLETSFHPKYETKIDQKQGRGNGVCGQK